ncbi:hypothetical protein J6590_050950 [Homalodisca vitripennis]|nr:hypothetical protein J6590_050950 [Homalodisca vitripennis]
MYVLQVSLSYLGPYLENISLVTSSPTLPQLWREWLYNHYRSHRNVCFTGFSIIPWALSGEYFPSNVKSYASTVVANVCFTGFSIIPWALSGEYFPSNVKSYASTVVANVCFTGFSIIPWALSGEYFPSNVKSYASTVVANVCFTGFSIIPWALSGEYFPSNVKSYASTVVASTCGLASFLVTKFFPHLADLLGLDVVFLSCSGFSLFTVVLVAICVEETSGLSFHEIQEILKGRKSEIRAKREPLPSEL